jgi:hypothetical protein
MHGCNQFCYMDTRFHQLQKDMQYTAFGQDDSDEWWGLLRERLLDYREAIDMFLAELPPAHPNQQQEGETK